MNFYVSILYNHHSNIKTQILSSTFKISEYSEFYYHELILHVLGLHVNGHMEKRQKVIHNFSLLSFHCLQTLQCFPSYNFINSFLKIFLKTNFQLFKFLVFLFSVPLIFFLLLFSSLHFFFLFNLLSFTKLFELEYQRIDFKTLFCPIYVFEVTTFPLTVTLTTYNEFGMLCSLFSFISNYILVSYMNFKINSILDMCSLIPKY